MNMENKFNLYLLSPILIPYTDRTGYYNQSVGKTKINQLYLHSGNPHFSFVTGITAKYLYVLPPPSGFCNLTNFKARSDGVCADYFYLPPCDILNINKTGSLDSLYCTSGAQEINVFNPILNKFWFAYNIIETLKN